MPPLPLIATVRADVAALRIWAMNRLPLCGKGASLLAFDRPVVGNRPAVWAVITFPKSQRVV